LYEEEEKRGAERQPALIKDEGDDVKALGACSFQMLNITNDVMTTTYVKSVTMLKPFTLLKCGRFGEGK